MSKLEQIQQRLIDDYGNLIQSFIEGNRLHLNYKGKGYKQSVYLCHNNYLRVYPDPDNPTWVDFKNVSSIIDYLKTNIIGE